MARSQQVTSEEASVSKEHRLARDVGSEAWSDGIGAQQDRASGTEWLDMVSGYI